MTHVEIAPTEFLHVRTICENMRERERAAFTALGWEPERVLTHEVARSLLAYTGLYDKRAVLIYGARCDTMLADEAYIWMVASGEIERLPLTVARHSREAVALLRQHFKRLHGLVVADYSCSIRWLRWLGCEIDPPEHGACKFRIG